MGFSKRSFAEWGTQVKKSFDEAGGGLRGFASALSTAFTVKNDEKDIIKYNGQIVTENNIDNYLSKLDETSAENQLKHLQDWQKAVNNDTKTWDNYFKTLDDRQKYLVDFVQNTDLQKASTEDLIKANQAARQSAINHNAALKQQTLGAKAAAAATGLLKTALNSIAYMAIIQAVTTLANTIITKFDEVVNAYQNGIDKLKNLSSEIKGLESEQSSLNSELKESQERLHELEQIKMPTLFEKDEIENLKEYNKQLEMQIRLKQLEIEQAKQEANKTAQETFKNSQTDNNPFDDAFTEDFEWWEHILNALTVNSWANLKNSFGNLSNWFQGNNWDQQMDYLKDAEILLENYLEAVEYAKTVDDEVVYKNLLEGQEYKKGKLDEHITDLSKRYQEWYTELLGLDPYDKANEERIKQLNDAMSRAEKVLNYEFTAKNFTEVYEDAQFSEIITKLEALAKAGELTEDTFNSVEGIDRFKEALQGIGTEGVSVEEAIRAINNRIQEESRYADNTAGSIQNLSETFEKLYDAIDDAISKQEKLADAFKKTRLGAKLTIQELYDLIKEMPSLAQYAEKDGDGYTISTEGFEAVSKENDNSIKELIAKDLESVRNDIALLEKEEELRAETENLYQQWENTGGANKNLKNQYDEVAEEYEDVAGQCQNITNSIEELTEYEKSLVILNDLVGSSFDEMSLIIDGVNAAFDKAKSEISNYNSNIQTIDNAIKTLKDGSLLTYDEMNALVDIAPDLQDSFEEQENGYSIVIDALEELREQSYKTRNDYIDDKIAETKAEIEAANSLKKAYQDKIDQIYSWGKSAILVNAEYIEELKGEISEIDKQSQPLYDIIEKLEGLRGNITTDDGDDDLSDKLQKQIDYYKTILSAVDAMQNKYAEAIDKEIGALEDGKAALRDSNDERQRELDLIEARNNLENAKKRIVLHVGKKRLIKRKKFKKYIEKIEKILEV